MSNRSTQPIDVHIGKRVRRRRERLNWTQQQLGDRLGVKFQQIQKYEVGQNRIAAGRLYEIAKLLRVPLLYFFEGYEGDDTAPPKVMPGTGRGFNEAGVVWNESESNPEPDLEHADDWQILADSYLAIPDRTLRQSILAVARALARPPGEPDGG